MIRLGGLQKTTLIDFPGRVACTVFTVGCNFRCPFCHNKDLVSLNNFKDSGLKEIKEKSFFEFLGKRKKILDGVCITGGEPTIQSDLSKFCKKVKKLGLEVKLDTNGYNPAMLKILIEDRLVDYVALDIKTCFGEYLKVVNPKSEIRNSKQIKNSNFINSKPLEKIKKSIKLILESGIEYEFRTTVVPGIHNKEKMIRLAKQLELLGSKLQAPSSKLNYVLQQFKPQNCLDPEYLKAEPFSSKQMQDILKSVQKILPKTKLRGEN